MMVSGNPAWPAFDLPEGPSRQTFLRDALPLHRRVAANTLLLARIAARKQHLAEGWRHKNIQALAGPNVDHAGVERDRIHDVPRLPASACTPDMLASVIRGGMPTVLEGAAAASFAVRTWTPDWLAAQYGDLHLPLWREHSAQRDRTLSDCIDQMSRTDGDEAVQINNVCGLFTQHPETLEHLPLRPFASRLRPLRYHGANLFICRDGQGSKYHCANELNLFFQVHGEKEWHFVHPRHSAQMAPLFTQPKGNYFECKVPFGQEPAGIPIGRALLRPGDVLINPPWWWHWVRNRGLTIGVATRWRSWRHRFGTANPTFSALQWLFPHQWRVLWHDYVRGGHLDESKWVHPDS